MTGKHDATGRKLIRNSAVEFLIFTAQGGEASIEARYEDETIWLSQRIMAELFGVDVRTVSEHLRNIFASGELDAEPTIRKFRIVQREGARDVTRSVEHYNLDAIISVGYRVNSVRATQFRQWATGVLRDLGYEATCVSQSVGLARLASARTPLQSRPRPERRGDSFPRRDEMRRRCG